MDTKAAILEIGDKLIREKGYNAFSFSDISKQLNIKNASVHYHFPTKTDLGISIIQEHLSRLRQLQQKSADQQPLQKLNAFFSIYTTAKSEDKICIVGSLATDLYTVEPEIQVELKKLVGEILQWVMDILDEGKTKGVFHFDISTRTKALMVITNMLAAVQLTRLTSNEDFLQIKQTVINDLTKA